ncbi:SDR family oxidoreductase [Nocardiopsis sp. CC223A]|uniref:SDR family oxidoreductase n=1 Tax=Nocardiopsis sp. CC223A TaxID=3044051 RepID=UPI00278C515F|nr:SDR family oxidoreductase [Nocardiopsis sp. CC223A]
MTTRPLTVAIGGDRGIGAATRARPAGDGHAIVFGHASDTGAAERTAERVRAAGARCAAVRVDTSVEADVDRLFDAAAEPGAVTGPVDNAAVTGPPGRFADTGTAVLGRMVTRCAAAGRRGTWRAGGRARSSASPRPPPWAAPDEYVHHAATKAVVDAMTVGLAKGLGPSGIRVNAVAPGVIETDPHTAMGDPDRPAGAAATIPLRRAGRPGEIADAIARPLSPGASRTTGTVLRVAGGR